MEELICLPCRRKNHQYCLGDFCTCVHSEILTGIGLETEEKSTHGKNRKNDYELIDPQSTGRKRAAKQYPLDPEADCDFANVIDAGLIPGLYGINGCGVRIGSTVGKQQARHHLDYNTLNNEPDNVVRICHSCLVPGTRLLTADLRWVAVDVLGIGDALVGFDEESTRWSHKQKSVSQNRKLQYSYVTATKLVSEPCYEITLATGQVLIASHAHMWPTKTSGRTDIIWQKTEHLSKYCQLQLFVEPWKQRNDWNAGWFAGLLDGEGSLNRQHLAVAQVENKATDLIQEMMERYAVYGELNTTLRPAQNNWKDTWVWRISNSRDIIRLLGEIRPYRLLDDFQTKILQRQYLGYRTVPVRITNIKSIGLREVIALETSTKTYIAEGYLSHNCHVLIHHKNDPIKDEYYASKYGSVAARGLQKTYKKLRGNND